MSIDSKPVRPHRLTAALLEGGPLLAGAHEALAELALGYTPGAGGALSGPESALSSLPACPCQWDAAPGETHRETRPERLLCGEASRPYAGRMFRCALGHRFAGTSAEHEQARGAFAAAEKENNQ